MRNVEPGCPATFRPFSPWSGCKPGREAAEVCPAHSPPNGHTEDCLYVVASVLGWFLRPKAWRPCVSRPVPPSVFHAHAAEQRGQARRVRAGVGRRAGLALEVSCKRGERRAEVSAPLQEVAHALQALPTHGHVGGGTATPRTGATRRARWWDRAGNAALASCSCCRHRFRDSPRVRQQVCRSVSTVVTRAGYFCLKPRIG